MDKEQGELWIAPEWLLWGVVFLFIVGLLGAFIAPLFH